MKEVSELFTLPCRRKYINKANVPADLQLSCKREQKQISYCIGMSLGSQILILYAVG